MKQTIFTAIFWITLFLAAPVGAVEVMEVNEVEFTTAQTYTNPYIEIDLWVTLTGPKGESFYVPAFWDGGKTFRVRLVGTSTGEWSWSTGTETGDTGLDNKSGTFMATETTEAEKVLNPNKRGFIRAKGHVLEYADGTPFFYTADTVWVALTKIFAWDSDAGLAEISFQGYFTARKNQGYNGVNVLASYPSDTVAGEGIWANSTKGEKVTESGHAPFLVSGSNVDYTKINPDYWKETDRKMKYLSDNGFVTFFESVRRHEPWRRDGNASDTFARYTRYLWARYGCYNMIYSWLHWDTNPENEYVDWLPILVDAHAYLKSKNGTGKMPYGQPRSAMSYGSSLDNWAKDAPQLLDLHNVSNKARDEKMYPWLRDIFRASPRLPAFNAEPYYPAVPVGLNASLDATEMAQFQMYGSVLNGGFAGHAWGDTFFGGVAFWIDPLVPVPNRSQKHALTMWKSDAMGHLKTFILDAGHEYGLLEPASDTHFADSRGDMHALAVASNKSFALGFYTTGFAPTEVLNLEPATNYIFQWWDIENGTWSDETIIQSSATGEVATPAVPDTARNWAFRFKDENYIPIVVLPTDEVNLANMRTYTDNDGWDRDGQYMVGNVHDGDASTRGHSATLAAGAQTWVQYDFEGTYTLTRASLLEDNGGNHEIAGWKVQYFDGVWNDAFAIQNSDSNRIQEIDFEDIPGVSKIRMVVTTPDSVEPKAEVFDFKCFGLPEKDGKPNISDMGNDVGSQSDTGTDSGSAPEDDAGNTNPDVDTDDTPTSQGCGCSATDDRNGAFGLGFCLLLLGFVGRRKKRR